MASTSSKNTPGDYRLEQSQYYRHFNLVNYVNGYQGKAFAPNNAGNGLIHGRMAMIDLASNAADIESYLFGIGSTNLVNPLPPVVPDIHRFSSLNIHERIPIIIPDPVIADTRQRANYLN
jgi:hypothetical protein